jgi:hypothetical protein
MTFVTVGEQNGHPIDLYFEDHGAGQPMAAGAGADQKARAVQ